MSLPAGILYVSAASEQDSLSGVACASLHSAWAEHGNAAGEGDDLRTYLRNGFFKRHKVVYENRPIYFPLSSAKRSFVAWVSIHRWTAQTLSNLLAEHLHPEKRRLEGELEDLRNARAQLLPYTKPHPEVCVASTITPSGGRLAGKYGLGMLCVAATTAAGYDVLGTNWHVGEQARGTCRHARLTRKFKVTRSW